VNGLETVKRSFTPGMEGGDAGELDIEAIQKRARLLADLEAP
jgi:hypothetical protein